MQKLFKDTRLLDKGTVEKYGLTEDIMMENAAAALEKAVFSGADKKGFQISGKQMSDKTISVLILTGSGNNGGDGYVLGRRLAGKADVQIFAVTKPKSPMCILQAERAEKTGLKSIGKSELDILLDKSIEKNCIIVDCIYGSGFHGTLDEEVATLIEKINSIDADNSYKIACDIPSGIDSLGNIETFVKSTGVNQESSTPLAFKADVTVTMGALKTALYSDFAKDFCGKIICADLGVARSLFEAADKTVEMEAFLFDKSDLVLPKRKKQNTNKGSFGHSAIICGEKPGAAIIAGSAAFGFGSGLVTLVLTEKQSVPEKCIAKNASTSPDGGTIQANSAGGAICTEGAIPVTCPAELMQSFKIPANTKSIAIGMGLGFESKSAEKLLSDLFVTQTKDSYIPMVFDADMFSRKETVEFLEKSNADKTEIVLTPHPKEFSSLLKMTGFGDFSVQEIVKNRISLCKTFVKNYPYCVLLLKGANVLITKSIVPAQSGRESTTQTFINPFGDSCIAKGGSGDVLAGLIASLLAQGYSPFEAAKNASLAHAIAASKMRGSYSVTPFSLIEEIGRLGKD